MRRTVPLLLIASALAAVALFLPEPSAEERLEAEAARLQGVVATETADLESRCAQLADSLTGDSLLVWRALSNARAELDERGIAIVASHNGTRYWTSSLPLDETYLDTTTGTHVRIGASVYLRAGVMGPHGSLHALLLLWYHPPFENRYLRKHFHPALGTANGVEASIEPGLGPVVRDRAGHVLFRLQWSGDPPPHVVAWFRLLALLACASILLLLLWRWAQALMERKAAWTAVLITTLVVVLVRAWSLATAPWPMLEDFPLFAPDLFAASSVLPSLGDLLIDVALLVFLAAFARRAVHRAARPKHRMLAIAVSLAVLLTAAAWIDDVLVSLVRDSSIPLDLFHPQGLDGTSMLALLAIAFLLIAWVLLADACVQWLAPEMSARAIVIATVVVFGLAHVVHHLLGNFDSLLVLWPAPVFASLVLLRRGRSRLVHALVIVTSLSLLTVHVLNRQNFKRTERDRQLLSESAATHEDPMIEWLFREARATIARDADAARLLDDTVAVPAAEIDTRLRQRFFQGTWNNYDVRLHLFGADGYLRGSTASGAPPTLDQLRDRFEQGVPVEGDNALRNTHRPVENALYIGAIGPQEAPLTGRLIVELLPRALPEGLGFPELLMAGDRAVEQRTDRYVLARYERGALVESHGNIAFPVRWSLQLPMDGLLFRLGDHELLATGNATTTVVLIGTRLPGLADHVTTFSYLFLFFALLGAGFLLLRAGLAWKGLPPFGVIAKLRTGIGLFTVIAIALFAIAARLTLDRNYSGHISELLDDRSRSAVAELRQHVRLEQDIRAGMMNDLDHWVDKAASVLLADIAAYSPTGALIATSREQLFNNGLLGARMDPDAFTAMAIEQRSAFTHEERIGDAAFLASYRPLLNDRGDVLAYLAVPYFARQSQVDDERTAGAVAIVNLLVVLFLLSTIAATLIAAWTTRPLSALKRGLERIQLGARNEPLPYQGDDELGGLVRVYNRKVEELRESAEKLARSERESAWKEMARQVAHEIKNPLTPMKLGIQHFQQTWDPNAADAKERLDRFSSSLVEQIDALSRVAGDFSRFAQMSAANESVLDLNDVAGSAVALFAGEPNVDISLSGSAPLFVKADREHLLRVFNNLIKNALQAIPEGRRGKVDVILGAEGGHATVEVRDNGAGVPDAIRDRIFEPSFTTKSSGMGLGLAMVKKMVEQAGGTVHFTTRLDAGTSFFVSLPLQK